MHTKGTFEAKTHLTRLRLVPVKPNGSRQIRETLAKLKQFSKGQTLGGLKVKDFIEDGRRVSGFVIKAWASEFIARSTAFDDGRKGLPTSP